MIELDLFFEDPAELGARMKEQEGSQSRDCMRYIT